MPLLLGESTGEGNAQPMLQYLQKKKVGMKLFVKNVRRRPGRLAKVQKAFTEERDQLMAKCTGNRWGLDWETQLVGDGSVLPPRPLVIKMGDALAIEVPISDDGGSTST